MTVQQARRLKPGQIVIYDNDPSETGTVLGILRSGVSVSWKGEIQTTEVVLWNNVENLSIWEPSN